MFGYARKTDKKNLTGKLILARLPPLFTLLWYRLLAYSQITNRWLKTFDHAKTHACQFDFPYTNIVVFGEIHFNIKTGWIVVHVLWCGRGNMLKIDCFHKIFNHRKNRIAANRNAHTTDTVERKNTHILPTGNWIL